MNYFHDLVDKTYFVDLETNQSFIPFGSPDAQIANMMMGARFPKSLLPLVLHEGAHHLTFMTPVGHTLAALAASVRIDLKAGENAGHILPRSVGYRYLRYQAALKLLTPLIEGLALFAEHDLIREGGEVTNNLFMALSIFSDSDFNPTALDHARMEANFNKAVAAARLDSSGIRRKLSLLSQPISATARGGYLPGYLLMKTIRAMAITLTSKWLEPEFFFEFALSFFFRDYVFAELLIGDSDSDCIAGCELWFNELLKYFQDRFAAFVQITSADLLAIEASLLGQNDAIRVNNHVQILSNIDVARRAADKVHEFVDKIYDAPEELTRIERSIFARRNTFRFAICKVRAEVKCGSLSMFNDRADQFKYIAKMPTRSGISDCEGIADVEFFMRMGTGMHEFIWGSTVSLLGELLCISTPHRDELRADFLEMISGRTGEALRVYQTETASSAKKLIDTPEMKEFLGEIEGYIDTVYATRALYSHLADIAPVITDMKLRGFAGLMKGTPDERRRAILTLSACTLCTSNKISIDAIADQLQFSDVSERDWDNMFLSLRERDYRGVFPDKKLIISI